MYRFHTRMFFLTFLSMMLFFHGGHASAALQKGIYITQSTLENTTLIHYLIGRATKTGINTFIVDLDKPSPRYKNNIQLLKDNHIFYVARITIFPGGGTPEQVQSEAYWEKKYQLVKAALAYGADQIQLDYIRYNTKQRPSSQNSKDILKVIQWFKNRINVPLQIDVFGVSAFGESKYIGQSIPLFASSVDVVCPMVYPSHYVPFDVHVKTPYKTVYDSLVSLKKQFDDSKLPFKLYPYIELSNYHYLLSHEKKLNYIYAQIQAAENAGADGWYVWSPHNKYDSLFQILETRKVK
ncbi:MAG: hypothetical protein K0R24_938 [Gammaproteobacteria bacterium]|nr:hypothetical protein [Gammaproteobacteria bacterium]